jgi:hypothetical protein
MSKYNIGESVVVTKTRRTGNVVKKDGAKVLVEYTTGEKQWIEESACSKLLLEIDPPQKSGMNLTEDN